MCAFSNTIIQLDCVNAGYGNKKVLLNASLHVYERDFLGIIGPNGGGKTTLVKLILGLLRPEEGNVTYFREDHKVDRLRFGYLPQYSTFDRKFPISVRDVILSGLHSCKNIFCRFNREDREKAERVLSELNLSDLCNKTIGELSGGQRQRVLIGRALISEPEVLILDEPNTYIDRENQEKLYQLLLELNKKYTIILVSHDVGTIVRSVRNIACVNRNIHYHPASELTGEILEKTFGCPFELIAHGHIPHRILEEHH